MAGCDALYTETSSLNVSMVSCVNPIEASSSGISIAPVNAVALSQSVDEVPKLHHHLKK